MLGSFMNYYILCSIYDNSIAFTFDWACNCVLWIYKSTNKKKIIRFSIPLTHLIKQLISFKGIIVYKSKILGV